MSSLRVLLLGSHLRVLSKASLLSLASRSISIGEVATLLDRCRVVEFVHGVLTDDLVWPSTLETIPQLRGMDRCGTIRRHPVLVSIIQMGQTIAWVVRLRLVDVRIGNKHASELALTASL